MKRVVTVLVVLLVYLSLQGADFICFQEDKNYINDTDTFTIYCEIDKKMEKITMNWNVTVLTVRTAITWKRNLGKFFLKKMRKDLLNQDVLQFTDVTVVSKVSKRYKFKNILFEGVPYTYVLNEYLRKNRIRYRINDKKKE